MTEEEREQQMSDIAVFMIMLTLFCGGISYCVFALVALRCMFTHWR